MPLSRSQIWHKPVGHPRLSSPRLAVHLRLFRDRGSWPRHDRCPAARKVGPVCLKGILAVPARFRNVDPIMLPPGRAGLATAPASTALPMAAMTIGIVDVACLRARVQGVP